MKLLGKITITKVLVAVAIVAAIVGIVTSILTSYALLPLASFGLVALTLILAFFGVMWKFTKDIENEAYRVFIRILIAVVAAAVIYGLLYAVAFVYYFPPFLADVGLFLAP